MKSIATHIDEYTPALPPVCRFRVVLDERPMYAPL
jgi:hypothetical protein